MKQKQTSKIHNLILQQKQSAAEDHFIAKENVSYPSKHRLPDFALFIFYIYCIPQVDLGVAILVNHNYFSTELFKMYDSNNVAVWEDHD